VVVMGGVAPDGVPPRLTVEMVLAGGRNNSLAEFRSLAAECGLAVRAAYRHPSGRFTVECRPV
jgi:2,7-dihydroxy-5-methyl-1-naphthoate 7-O-methyltransferase